MAEGGRRSAAPDGGWGWMIVAGCFLTTICTRAVTRCVSIFFVEFHMHFSSDYSRTAWIHSLVDCTTMLCAPLGSYIGNRLSCRAAVMVGGLLSSAGLILSSFATSLEYLYLSLGVLTGVGFAFSYTPAIAMVGTYFKERKALAYGIAMSGTGIGTFILAPVVQLLIELYSWRGALLILGGLVSHLCVCGALMRPLVNPRLKQSSKKEFEVDVVKSKLHVELDLEKAKAPKESLEMGESDCGAVNKDKESSGDLTDEDKPEEECEETESLLRNGEQVITESNPAEEQLIDSIRRGFTLEEKTSGDSDMKENIKDIDSKPEDTKGILVNRTSKDSEQEINIKSTNLKNPNQKTRSDASLDANPKLTDPNLAVLVLGDSALHDSKLAESVLADSELLCEVAFSESPGREKEGHFFLPSTDEYRFLLMPDFLLLSVSFLFLAFGCSVPFVYLVPYSLSIGVGHQQAALLMSVLGVMGIVGNITFGWISDRKCLRTYRIVSYLLAVGLEGLGCLFVPLLRNFSLLVPFALFYGYFDGAYVALLPVVTSDTVGPTYLSSALGVVCFLHAIPYLISPPIAGWLVDQTGSYTAAFLLSGFSLICSASILATVSLARRCNRRALSVLPGMTPLKGLLPCYEQHNFTHFETKEGIEPGLSGTYHCGGQLGD
ncbi:monocarboxylate transporter 12-B [Colossoma macropomum]|uniref:monocarboxylate transporter 12-B n=1 Tax=Colossoma macropomum TaxID=42526 RepID=UPI001864DDE1|nr:monocarboxylate transporter 12-B [Colossoma macropomum]